jgi:hypothetical protein
MFEKLSFPFKKLSICLVGVVGMCLWGQDAFAQEHEKVEIEISKNAEKINLEDHTGSQESGFQKSTLSKPTQPVIKSVTPPTKKEVVMAPEGKKPEQASSTLSFNIFLYIVDKFRAD